MHLLQSGVDLSVIALWLGHESPSTTHGYMEADLAMKERALNSIQPPHVKSRRYRPPDRILQFLESLQLCAVRRAAHSHESARRLAPILPPRYSSHRARLTT
jgi:hypothetical protein